MTRASITKNKPRLITAIHSIVGTSRIDPFTSSTLISSESGKPLVNEFLSCPLIFLVIFWFSSLISISFFLDYSMDFFTGNQSINEQAPITPQTSQNRIQSNTTPPSFNSPTFIQQQPNEFMCLVCKEKFPSEEARFAHLSNTSIPCHAETPLLFRTACILCLKDCETVSPSQVATKHRTKTRS